MGRRAASLVTPAHDRGAGVSLKSRQRRGMATATTLAGMSRWSALVLLLVLGTGVFLAGLELMITAVALPSILADLADPASGSAWIELRKASWIINGYLLVYILTMPMAGRLADLWGARRLFIGSLVVFIIGSALAGAAQDLDQLIAARLFQALGGGVLVPVGTAAASHLFSGPGRPRALGVVGALTFLGMATGPVVGAAILASVHADGAIVAAGLDGTVVASILAPAWRWVFFINIPIGIIALALAWAASPGWETPRRTGRIDIVGAAWFGLALVALLLGLTLIGSTEVAGTALDPASVTAGLLVIAAIAAATTIIRGLLVRDPFLEPRLFRSPAFSSAALVSLLTGYAFATAIIGGAVFVDRVLYGGPDDQRLALGALAGATAIGALVSGLIVRIVSLRLVALIGVVLSVAGLAAMSTWTPDASLEVVALALGTFGFGFGLTVTPRSTAAVEIGRSQRVRDRVVGRHRGADARDGGWAGDPDGVRLDDHRPTVERGLCDARRVPPVHPGIAARSAVARPAGRRGTRGMGVSRGCLDHGRAVRCGGGRHGRSDPTEPRPRRPVGRPGAPGRGPLRRPKRDRRDRGRTCCRWPRHTRNRACPVGGEHEPRPGQHVLRPVAAPCFPFVMRPSSVCRMLARMSFIGDLERLFGEFIFPNRVPIGIGIGIALAILLGMAWRGRWDRPLRRHPRRTLGVLVPALLVIVPVTWLLASPLIIRTELVEGDPMPSGEIASLRSGEFVGADDFHFGSGRARIVDSGSGFILRFEDFSVLNGPDLHVYLSPSPDGYATGATDLGKLKATDGSFNYELPPDLDPSAIGSIVIWCEPFAVQFAHAPLETR